MPEAIELPELDRPPKDGLWRDEHLPITDEEAVHGNAEYEWQQAEGDR